MAKIYRILHPSSDFDTVKDLSPPLPVIYVDGRSISVATGFDCSGDSLAEQIQDTLSIKQMLDDQNILLRVRAALGLAITCHVGAFWKNDCRAVED